MAFSFVPTFRHFSTPVDPACVVTWLARQQHAFFLNTLVSISNTMPSAGAGVLNVIALIGTAYTGNEVACMHDLPELIAFLHSVVTAAVRRAAWYIVVVSAQKGITPGAIDR